MSKPSFLRVGQTVYARFSTRVMPSYSFIPQGAQGTVVEVVGRTQKSRRYRVRWRVQEGESGWYDAEALHVEAPSRDVRRRRQARRSARRDPSAELPKSVRTKKVAIERSIRKLSESANDRRESLRLKQKIDDAIFRLQTHGRSAGADLAGLSRALDDLFRGAVVAMNRSVENYSKYLEEQASRLRQKVREAQPTPGTYEHELALMRGGYRR